MKLYLAGPMTGVPQFNFPMFNRAAAFLRSLGHEVINPAEEDSPEIRTRALASLDGDPAALLRDTGESWGTLLARDVKIVADDIEGIVLLPGWLGSRGALLEATVAFLCKKTALTLYLSPDNTHITLLALDRRTLHSRIAEGLRDQL